MPGSVRVALIGDFDSGVVAHQAIPRAVALAAAAAGHGFEVEAAWVPTDSITTDDRLVDFDAVWCVPASPYRSTEGALRAIRFARERHVPFLGTCGGFQHAVVEYARSVLGWSHAEHAEKAPFAALPVVSRLTCSLVEVSGAVRFSEGSHLRRAYGVAEAVESYHCSYGVNPRIRRALTARGLRVVAEDQAGDVRAIELDDHPFFVATLFQPERAALRNEVPPLVQALVVAAATAASRSGRFGPSRVTAATSDGSSGCPASRHREGRTTRSCLRSPGTGREK